MLSFIEKLEATSVNDATLAVTVLALIVVSDAILEESESTASAFIDAAFAVKTLRVAALDASAPAETADKDATLAVRFSE